MRGCAVSRGYINVCNSYVFSVVNMYLDHLQSCIVFVNGRMYVCFERYVSQTSVISPPLDLYDISMCTVV